MNKTLINNKIAALYIRLSEEDEEKKDYSRSIQNQIHLLSDYALEEGFYIYKTYIDDGFSGKDFSRPKFQELIDDLNRKKFNCIIVKDLSRFGRNLIEVGEYLEEIFPKKKIRFIAISDHYDSATNEDDSYLLRCFMNDRYLKDCKKKANRTYEFLATKKDICTEPLYGYKFDESHQLVIDDESSIIVQKIFALYIQGNGITKIAKTLEEEKIWIPTVYKIKKGYRLKDKYKKNPYKWDKTTILRIIKNEEYVGVAINLNKSHRRNVEVKRIENAHPAIVDKETFELANKILKQKQKLVSLTLDQERLKGMIFLNGERLRYWKAAPYMKWGHHLYVTNTKPRKSIRADFVHKVIFQEISKLINSIKLDENSIQSFIKTDDMKLQLETKDNIERRLSQLNLSLKKLFENYALENITLYEFNKSREKLQKEQQELEDKLMIVNHKIEESKVSKNEIRKFINKIKSLSSECNDLDLVRKLIERVDIFSKRDKYTFNFIYRTKKESQ